MSSLDNIFQFYSGLWYFCLNILLLEKLFRNGKNHPSNKSKFPKNYPKTRKEVYKEKTSHRVVSPIVKGVGTRTGTRFVFSGWKKKKSLPSVPARRILIGKDLYLFYNDKFACIPCTRFSGRNNGAKVSSRSVYSARTRSVCTRESRDGATWYP